MYKNKKILAIIPARGDSKGIPRKNIRMLAGKPLIAYTIEAAKKSRYLDRIIVSTEDEEIAEVARIYNIQVIWRPRELAKDDVALDPVIFHALNKIEEKEGKYDIVVTIQPTSPLLSVETIDKAINIISKKDCDTLISVIDKTHIYWMKKNDEFTLLNEGRKNRQYLNPIYKETGSLLISKRNIITKRGRIGKKIYPFVIPKGEGIDIDNYIDWGIAEALVNKLKIAFRVDGSTEIGLGHVYRAITLANRIFQHDVVFLMNKSKKLGIKKVEEYNYPIITFENDRELFKKINEIKPDIVVNDILDTSKEYMKKLRDRKVFIVNFEDLGEGADFANIVINALYENSYPPENCFYGYKYACLRDEFQLFPFKKIKKQLNKILITFGGVDENNLTLRSLKAVERAVLRDKEIRIILGLGYSNKEDLNYYVNHLITKGFNIKIYENVKMMAKYIHDADLVITSNGRTIYEVVSIGTPCISISQNERESRHLFSHTSGSILNLGMAFNVSEEDIAKSIMKLIRDVKQRKEMNSRMLKFNIRKGTERVLRLIFDKYEEWKENEKNKNR
ncbi:MAG: UDP-2,4-diacetamido-2,4,6-trideoxy-beta-L-altropyranose hydrolase [Spirochaetes bacterium]|nr:MAG: UDP-2,4-diacetamido-2,4,6-trideoxy-beta-L-altropyranose hydrolase [Spirochaetota bacterium]